VSKDTEICDPDTLPDIVVLRTSSVVWFLGS